MQLCMSILFNNKFNDDIYAHIVLDPFVIITSSSLSVILICIHAFLKMTFEKIIQSKYILVVFIMTSMPYDCIGGYISN